MTDYSGAAGKLKELLDYAGDGIREDMGKYDPKRGTVVGYAQDGKVNVAVDGGETSPATKAVKCSVNDRVVLENIGHTLTVVENLSDPSAGSSEIEGAVEAASAAAEAAEAAQEAADAVGQHFWTDAQGVHVTDDEREDYEEAAEGGFPDASEQNPYANMLANAQGFLLRFADKVRAAFTPSSASFFDGAGNNAANVVATFGASGATIGKESGHHAVIDADGFYVKDGDDLIAVTQVGDDGAEFYLGDETEATTFTKAGDYYASNSGRTSYDFYFAFSENPTEYESDYGKYAYDLYNVIPSGPNYTEVGRKYGQAVITVLDSGGNYKQTDIIDASGHLVYRILELYIGSSTTRTGISSGSYIYTSSASIHYECAWFDGSLNEVSSQHNGMITVPDYLLSPQSVTLPRFGLKMAYGDGGGEMSMDEEQFYPTFMTASKASYTPAAAPCVVVDTSDTTAWLYASGSYRKLNHVAMTWNQVKAAYTWNELKGA